MKLSIIAVVVAFSAVSVPAFALDVSQAQEAVSHAERNYSAAQDSYNRQALEQGSGVNGSREEANLNQAATARAQAYADLRSAQDAAASAASTVNQAPGTLSPTATYSQATVAPSYSGVSPRPGYNVPAPVSTPTPAAPAQSINVSAATLHPDTPVNVTVNGVAQTTTAGALAAVNPSIQVAVPHIAAFQLNSVKGGRNSDSNNGSHVQGDNNGGSNAHANAMGAHGQNGQRSGKSAAGNF